MIAAILFAVTLLLPETALAADVETAGATSCTVRGFAIDPDPKGTNIRSAPRADAPVIGRLSPRVHLSRIDIVGMEFEIVGSRNGWLLIKSAQNEQDPNEKAFAGPGWISGRLVGVTLGSANLRAQPRRDAAVIARLANQIGRAHV